MEAVFGSRETTVDSEAIRAKIERQEIENTDAKHGVADVN